MVTPSTPIEVNAPSALQDAIISFITKLVEAPADTAVQDIQVQWQEAWESFAHKAPSTRASYTSYYRNAIRDNLGREHIALKVVRPLDTDEREGRKQTARVSGKGSGRMPRRQEDIEAFVGKVNELWNERSKALKTLGVNKADQEFSAKLTPIWKNEIDDLRKRLTINSMASAIAEYRRALRNANLDDELIFAVVSTPEDVTAARRKDYLNSVVSRNHALIPFPKWHELLEAAEAVLPEPPGIWRTLEDDAKEYARSVSREAAVQIGVALQLLTGRRSYEVFCCGSFAPAPIEMDYGDTHAMSGATVGKAYSNWNLLFSGQAKTRGRAGTRFEEEFLIPVLAPAKTVLFAFLVMRNSPDGKEWPELTNAEFRQELTMPNTARGIQPSIKNDLYGPFWPSPPLNMPPANLSLYNIDSQNIRSLYAEIADTHFRRSNMSKVAFLSAILGHGKEDMQTAHSYMRYVLTDIKDKALVQRSKSRLVQKIIADYDVRHQMEPTVPEVKKTKKKTKS